MLIYKINAQYALPVSQPFLGFKIHFPASAAIGFAQCACSSCLIGSA